MRYRDVVTVAPLLVSVGMAAVGSVFRTQHPTTPNYDFAAMGGLLGAVSFGIGLYIAFFERRRPDHYPKAWQRFAVALLLWFGGCLAMAWNLAYAKPHG